MKTSFLSFLLLALATFCATAQELTVGTYNIRNRNDGDSIRGEIWTRRCRVMCDMLNWESPDVFGTQEVLHRQLLDMLQNLDGYGYIGVARDDGKQDGEYSAIFYKQDRVRLLDSGNFWLNETPDRPALGWDAACIRICTWGRFLDLRSNKEFLFLNLHMDHVGKVARREAAKLVSQRIQQMAEGKRLTVLTGDFNVDQHDEVFTIFTRSGLLKDCYEATRLRFAEKLERLADPYRMFRKPVGFPEFIHGACTHPGLSARAQIERDVVRRPVVNGFDHSFSGIHGPSAGVRNDRTDHGATGFLWYDYTPWEE